MWEARMLRQFRRTSGDIPERLAHARGGHLKESVARTSNHSSPPYGSCDLCAVASPSLWLTPVRQSVAPSARRARGENAEAGAACGRALEGDCAVVRDRKSTRLNS